MENKPKTKPLSVIPRSDLIRIAFVGVGVLLTWLRFVPTFGGLDLLAIGALLIGGYPIYEEAWHAIRHRHMTMELSMTIALVAAAAIGEFMTALLIVFFVLIAEVIEDLTVDRGRSAMKQLLALLPQIAFVRRSGEVQEIKIEEVAIGDLIVLKPGALVPVDGVVTSGRTSIDQSSITGESLPSEKEIGSTVYAGTINQTGTVDVRATGIGRETAFGKIIETVEHAEEHRAPIQKTADRLSGYLVYLALAAAAFTYLVTKDIRSTISVIIVAGACGIAAGTPLAVLGAISTAARRGVIIKGGTYVEALSRIANVVLDKTGTLTFGAPVVTSIIPAAGFSESEVIRNAASIERPSEHSLARAILKKADEFSFDQVEPTGFIYKPGRGVSGIIAGEQVVVGNRAWLSENSVVDTATLQLEHNDGVILIARAKKFLGSILVEDQIRPESRQAIEALRSLEIQTHMFTGDTKKIATRVAAQLGVDDVKYELLPEDKARCVREMVANGQKVAMIGDGINDAPSLVEATVGVAMGSGTEIARETADVLLIGNDLNKFVDALRISRRCMKIINQNFVGTIVVDSVGVVLAAFGLLSPLSAVFIHVTSELVFIFNSTRMLSD
jgi:Cd2+/Zn2+-exporting ATPase/Cu+-exporting ATPase